MGHHLLEPLLLVVSEAVLLLALALVVGVIPVVVVVHVGGVELLPLGVVGDEAGGVTTLKAAPLGDLLLFLRNLFKARNFLTNKAISSSGMLSYC
jgi:hypothetical protein